MIFKQGIWDEYTEYLHLHKNMLDRPIIECVPNFSEGRNQQVLDQIAREIKSVEGVALLDVDPGKATHRTVVTFVGEPEPVIEAAFRAIKCAASLIDMSKHSGEHPRMGATDVCPLIPIANISMEEVAAYAHKLAKRVGEELDIPVYMYESAATTPWRKNLATVRSGEYEALPEKLKEDKWKPDYGPARFNQKSGATAVGARDFLIAYNVNLNTTSTRRANSVAFDVREQGRVLREGDPVTGKVIQDENGEPKRQPGKCMAVKGIGWFIEEYGIAQVSMNITDTKVSPLHTVFEACRESAATRGMRVTGSEIVGLVPLQVMLDAGKYFLEKQERSTGVSEEEIIKIAVKSMGLDELSSFDPHKKIIEYQLRSQADNRLVQMDLRAFANETASESPAPGGGSISAYVGALGASLTAMVANLSSHKRGWDDRWAYFSDFAVQAQELKDKLLYLVDEDTRAFNAILEAFRLPKGTDEEKQTRKDAIQKATKYAIEIPRQVLNTSFKVFDLAEAMVREGNPNSISDAAVGALCAKAAVYGAYLNVSINAADYEDKAYVDEVLSEATALVKSADEKEAKIIQLTKDKM
jgi:glutamate formiminotransferase / formiminotetrahydrofolate cyclodeaminase